MFPEFHYPPDETKWLPALSAQSCQLRTRHSTRSNPSVPCDRGDDE